MLYRNTFTGVKPLPGARLNRAHPLANKLALAFLFNEGAGGTVHDLSGRGNDGTINDANLNTIWEAGRSGKRLHFDGNDDDISISDSPTINFSNFFSVVTSVSFDTIPTSGSSDTILGKGTTSEVAGTNHNYLLTLSNNQFGASGTVGFNLLYESAAGANQDTTDVFTPLVNTTYQIVGTFDFIGDQQRLYRDGILRDFTTHTATVDQNTVDATIGQFTNTGAASSVNNLDGHLDYMFVFNHVLSADDVVSFYRNPYQMFVNRINPFLYGKVPAVAGGNEGAAMYHHLQNLGVY